MKAWQRVLAFLAGALIFLWGCWSGLRGSLGYFPPLWTRRRK